MSLAIRFKRIGFIIFAEVDANDMAAWQMIAGKSMRLAAVIVEPETHRLHRVGKISGPVQLDDNIAHPRPSCDGE
jgi:hypothetical protein